MPTAMQREWVARVLGITGGVPRPGDGGRAALADWQRERGMAVVQLRKLGRAIAAADDPEARPAMILIEAIAKNLTPEPKDRRAVAELDRYLRTDDIIVEAETRNGFGIDIALREPLLRALGALRDSLPE